MKNQTQIQTEQIREAKIQDVELEAIATALRVRTGIRAGTKPITPCV